MKFQQILTAAVLAFVAVAASLAAHALPANLQPKSNITIPAQTQSTVVLMGATSADLSCELHYDASSSDRTLTTGQMLVLTGYVQKAYVLADYLNAWKACYGVDLTGKVANVQDFDAAVFKSNGIHAYQVLPTTYEFDLNIPGFTNANLLCSQYTQTPASESDVFMALQKLSRIAP